jgi:hypothetical protein
VLSWTSWEGSAAEWDNLLLQFDEYTFHQSYEWGEHKSRTGWMPFRLTAIEDGRAVGMAQVLVRRFPAGVALAWIPGGPIGAADAWGKQFRDAVRRVARATFLYCRVSPMRERSGSDVECMIQTGWRRAISPLVSGKSLAYSLIEPESVREGQATRNWRHNLRRSAKQGHTVRVWPSPNPDEMLEVYQAMQSLKKLSEQISRPALVSILDGFGSNCVIVRCDDAGGRLLAFRGALIFGEKGWDIFAAATPEARKVYASHAAFWELMKQCAARGVLLYDMGGVDPVGNKGVYDFKKGTGGSDVSYLGEWDWASLPLLRRAADFLIKRRSQAGGM